MREKIITILKESNFEGDIDYTEESREKYSHDASLLSIKPEIIVFPKNSDVIKRLTIAVKKHNTIYVEKISLTMRAAGTDMTGGSIGESIIVDTTRYMNKIITVDSTHAVVMPGVYYRDLMEAMSEFKVMMPAFPASAHLCAVGGMFANNCGGEKTLKYGKAEQWVQSSK